jgi:tetratricopeptide (TPR) repeat protein
LDDSVVWYAGKVRKATLLLALALVATRASAQAPAEDTAAEARQQYNLGTAAYKEKRYVEAALHFEAAAAHRAHAVTLYTAALAWEQANRPERACDDFSRALEVTGLSAQQTANARERVASLERTLGTVVVIAPVDWRVQLEGLSEVGVPARLHATPGVHKLLVRAPNRPVDRRDVTLELGQTTRVELEDAPPPESPPPPQAKRDEPPRVIVAPPPPPAPRTAITKPLGFVAIGAGVAALGAGVVLGTQALSAKDAYDAAPTRASFDHAHALQTWTTIAFIAGGAFAVGGVVLVLLPGPKARTSTALYVSAEGAAIRGTF